MEITDLGPGVALEPSASLLSSTSLKPLALTLCRCLALVFVFPRNGLGQICCRMAGGTVFLNLAFSCSGAPTATAGASTVGAEQTTTFMNPSKKLSKSTDPRKTSLTGTSMERRSSSVMTFKKPLKVEWRRNFDEKQHKAQDKLCKGRELIKKREDDCGASRKKPVWGSEDPHGEDGGQAAEEGG